MAEEEKNGSKGPVVFIRGGGSTGTAASEKAFEWRYQDAERRRDEAEAEKEKASDPVKIKRDDLPETPDGDRAVTKLPSRADKAVMYASQLTSNPKMPVGYIKLQYLTASGSPWRVGTEDVICVADLIIGARPQYPTELCLVLICPRCAVQSHKHLQDNQIRIFQRNKNFEFVPADKKETFVFEGDVYNSLGTIVESEKFKCPDCIWEACIENNFVRTLKA